MCNCCLKRKREISVSLSLTTTLSLSLTLQSTSFHMKPVLDLSQCFRDSPDYRLDLQKAESVVWQLDQLCKSLVKASKQQQDSGQGMRFYFSKKFRKSVTLLDYMCV